MKNRIRRNIVCGVWAAGLVFGTCLSARGAGDSSYLRAFQTAKEQEAEATGEDPAEIPDSRFLVTDREENDLRVSSVAGQCLENGAERTFYVIGKNYMPEGSVLPVLFGGRVEYSRVPEQSFRQGTDTYYMVRFALRGTTDGGKTAGNDPASGSADVKDRNRRRWELGDVTVCRLDGVDYRFRCIDQNYGDGGASGRSLALFLCEEVIPADTGSRYVYGQREDGYGAVFEPGPIVCFGESSEYRDSAVRAWLTGQEDQDGLCPVNAGVTRSYLGQTAEGDYSRFDPSCLHSYGMGSQILMDRYFLLSLEEAVKYREYLWQIDGLEEKEAGDAASSFCKGYWLRTPAGDGKSADTGMVYVVDLVNGNIHPQEVKPGGTRGEEELDVTSPIGVRPAFVLPQEM